MTVFAEDDHFLGDYVDHELQGIDDYYICLECTISNVTS
jgi:hypothetical protein